MIILTPQTCAKCDHYDFEAISEDSDGVVFRCMGCDEAFKMDVSHQYAIISDKENEPDIKWKGKIN